ncbi:sensor histidine kinase [Clostridium sp. Marseille-P2415]|uniref:sensor histidine kinase n=1 Tax=Clostridium sp. Marseille-P2415 TaxID=1805471 RepID=UPI0009884A27|nr:histidine kinase [Clostridium sp. Marseille-P2415]
MKNNWKHLWENLPITRKLFLEIAVTAVVLFASNLFIYAQINQMVERMNSVYMSNVNLNELSDALTGVQNYMYKYLQVKDSESLNDYYRAEQDYRKLLEGLSVAVTDNQIQILEKNIHNMSDSYLRLTDETVQAKRGQNVEKYKSSYEAALKLYQFINHDISVLNSQQFKNNSASYQTLQAALQYLEVISSVILVIVMIISITVMMMMTKDIVTPLTDLAHTAKLVGQGNFHVKVPPIRAGDELGIVTGTFNQMVDSLDEYVNKIKESAEKEQEMKERELLMENHLKEAQLKYLQFQINPHFLFNCLNAGVQLAMMEDAEKTSVFMEKMADFFRYNVKKGSEDATIREEVETVENYIYILNVRFAGDIRYDSRIDEGAMDISIPSMILQPLVENAVNHGIRNIDWPGKIHLTVKNCPEEIEIRIEDNGKGMEKEKLERIRAGGQTAEEADSTGIGLHNVISRLSLYYKDDGIFHIFSEGEDKGTAVVLRIPKRGGNVHVSDTGS